MRTWVVILLLVSSGAFAAKKKKKGPPPPPPVPTEPSAKLADALTEKPTGMLTAATKVVLQRVTFQPGVRPNPQLAVGVDYEKTGTVRELTEGEVKRFKGLLYDAKSFKFEKAPPCGEFSPELVFLATSDADTGTLEMLVSFKCSGIMFFTAKTAGRSLPGAQLNFAPSRKALLTMVKELMPQEQAVQALK
jgi:hypothetical protein